MSRVVAITGASAGVGRAAARRFARRGDQVALLARGDDGLKAAMKEVEAVGSRGMSIPLDVADWAEVEEAADRVEAELGAIDVWVNNAMATVFGSVEKVSPEEFRRVTEVTYLGTVHGTLAALSRMRRRRAGVIVQVGSALAYRSIPLQAAYCAAKHAARGFTDSLRTELIHQRAGVHLTTVHLPALNTPQFVWSRNLMGRKPQPVPPIYQPEVAADAIEWASRATRREVWVGRPTAMAIIGQRLAPWLLDLYLGRKGYQAQLRSEVAEDRADNLFDPLPGDFGAHGPFDHRSRDWSPQFWLTRHRVAVTGLIAAGAGLFLLNRS